MDCGFDLLINTVFINTRVRVDPKCYGFAFVNKGDTGVHINDTYLKPYLPGFPGLDGGSFAFVDEQGRLFRRKVFVVVFDSAPFINPFIQITQNLKIL